jgi:hypothetical protein
MSFWIMLCLLAGCGGQDSVESVQETSIAESPPTDPDDPFDGPVNSTSPSKKMADFDSLIALIEDTIGSPIGEEDEKQPPFSPPLNDVQIRDALRQSVEHAITSPDLADTRDFYGTHGDSEVILVNDGPIKWPDDFKPEVAGFGLRFASQFAPDGQCKDRRLGIRLDKLDLSAPSDGFMDGNIVLSLINVGGTRYGTVIGGCRVYYVVQIREDKIVARAGWLLDP